MYIIVYLGRRLSNHPLTQSITQCTALVHTLHMTNLWQRSCSKYYAMHCLGTYFTRAQTCDNVRVHSATEWTAWVHTFHMPKPVRTFVLKCYAMHCFGTYFTHAQTCDTVRVQSATQCTAGVHTLHILDGS